MKAYTPSLKSSVRLASSWALASSSNAPLRSLSSERLSNHFDSEIAFVVNTEVVGVTTRREGFDFVETFIVDLPWENEMTKQMRFAWNRAGKTHASLKNDAGFLRNHSHRPARAHHAGELAKDFHDSWLAPGKQIFERKFAARMPHIFAGEPLTAFRTFPKRTLRAYSHSMVLGGLLEMS